MGPLTRTGRHCFLLFLVLGLTISATYAQTPPFIGQCVASSVPAPVRTEGLTERLGDIQIQCSGSNPGAVLAGNLTIALPVSVTNRISSTNLSSDLLLSVDYGSGFVTLPTAAQISGNTVVLNALSFTTPPSGVFTFRISNLRAAVAQLGASTNIPVRAQLAFIGTQIPLTQSVLTVGVTQTGLFATLYNRGVITCVGSPVPDASSPTLATLFSTGTFFATTRLTEGYSTAFQTRGPGDDSGTRFLLQFTGLPAGARIFVPDFVAGSSAATPTSAGDLGVQRSGGVYVPGSGTLLLARIPAADTSGAGGTLALPSGSGSISLTSASEVNVAANGSASAVFEVVDAHPNLLESVQIPVFIGIPSLTGVANAEEAVSFAPVSNIQTASVNAPIPRFTARPPNSDCQLVGDCGASYYPKLSVGTVSTQVTGVAGGALVGYSFPIIISNSGGSIMPWAASVQYENGSGWLSLIGPTSGLNNASIRMNADPKGLTAGTYHANVTIDAGPVAGSVVVPVTFVVTPAPAAASSGTGTSTGAGTATGTGTGSTSGTGTTPAAASSVTVTRVVNAATFDPTPLVAGSLGTVMGSNLSGNNVSVTFDGVPADVLYKSATQLNLRVPASMRGKNSANMVVTVDGVSSSPQTVVLAPAWPAIFPHGVLNQDNSVNGPDAAAGSGSILQIYATGIPDGATVSVQVGNRADLVPLYAGVAPDVPGVQQVNVAVPDGAAGPNASLKICAAVVGQQFCSSGFSLAVQ